MAPKFIDFIINTHRPKLWRFVTMIVGAAFIAAVLLDLASHLANRVRQAPRRRHDGDGGGEEGIELESMGDRAV
ncbi:hypothetical protein EJ08DRAFT_701482 [Tothia fuscella]|uniref:Uncharacterized protein n=1 Tax=Tothia fuscella TaxID=1048955 RepID=A0A9P4NI62_9PEZI|nr:hypothetical protein EJ08DRAFT_701482 [Tothia fuscella]